MAHGVVPDSAARAARQGMGPLARALRAAGISANAVTVVGVVLTVVGAALVALEMPLAGLLTLIVGSLADTLDGVVARASGGGTPVGAFLDSTADRIADAALFSAAAWLGAARADPLLFWAALAALSGSFLVSYVRAKAESLGVRATVGPAPREARLLVLLLGLAAWALFALGAAFTYAVVAVAILAAITALQRIAVVMRSLGRA
jgi:CDP-diacylglycerol--glycerol-3-phosphate 3-phosphatidyltransferase